MWEKLFGKARKNDENAKKNQAVSPDGKKADEKPKNEVRWMVEAPNGWQVTVPESRVKETLDAFNNSDRPLTEEERKKADEIVRMIYGKKI